MGFIIFILALVFIAAIVRVYISLANLSPKMLKYQASLDLEKARIKAQGGAELVTIKQQAEILAEIKKISKNPEGIINEKS